MKSSFKSNLAMSSDLINLLKKVKRSLWWLGIRLLPSNLYTLIRFLIFGRFFITSCFGVGFQCHGYRKVKLGKDVLIGNYVRFQANPINIGEHSRIGHNNYLYGDIHIGRFFMSGPNVSIMAGNHGMEVNGVPMVFQNSKSKGIRIGDDVWLGCNSTILDGVNIANGSIIGAGSVVLQDTEPYSIYAGNPAKKIRDRLDYRQGE